MDMKLMYLYYTIHFFYGISYYIYGPYIPFLAELSGKSEPQFFPMFLAKGIGFLIGPIAKLTLFPKYQNLHQGLFFSTVVAGITTFLLTVSFNIPFLVIVSFVASFSFSMIDIFLNISIVSLGRENVAQYLSRGHGFQGLGFVVGPFFLGIYGVISLKFYGFFTLLFSLLLLLFPSPNSEEEKVNQNQQKEKTEIKSCPNDILIRVCCLIFMFAVIEHSYKTWYPTFCVMLGYVTKEEGAFNVSMIALFVTAFKFGNFHAVKALNVMTIGDLFLFTSTIFAFFLGYPNYLIYISAVLFAAFNFAQYPFYYALPTYYKYTMSIKNGTTIIMSYAFGETLLVTLSGYLMDFIHPIALHFYILIFVIVTRLLYTNTLKVMEKNRESLMQNEIQMGRV